MDKAVATALEAVADVGNAHGDELALSGHREAAAAQTAGPFDAGDCVRADASPEARAKLRPSFGIEDGTVTAGNASPPTDGAAALLLVDKEGLRTTGREPLARRGGGVGVAVPRIGVGQGLALVLERQGTQETP
ncbi:MULTISPECIES: hypothetical protein [Streptomyces]|uniref:acetyl-CoA C-acetyltransferase n=1 Tax=Streptomyces sp. 900129855 TaxID=3155129 RepID=A0ABV2ZFI3_9ACTN